MSGQCEVLFGPLPVVMPQVNVVVLFVIIIAGAIFYKRK